MPAAIPAALIGLGAGAAAAVITSTGIAIAVGVTAAFGAYQAFTGIPTPETPNIGGAIGSDTAQGINLNGASNTEAIPVVYGRRKLGGIPVMREVSGVKNRRLHLLHILSEGPIESIEGVYFNDEQVTVGQELQQQVVFTFDGLIDRWVHLRVRLVDAPGVGGTFTDNMNKIDAQYAAVGGFFQSIAEDKDGWLNTQITLDPFDNTALQPGDNLYLRVTDKSDGSIVRIRQQPTAANGWVLECTLHDKVDSVPSVNFFEFTMTRTGKTVDRSYATASEVWPILGNQDLGNGLSPADEFVLSKMEADLPGIWDATKRIPQLAALYIIIDYDPEVFQSLPNITADIKGRLVYDPRSTLTAWSDNPALCTRDYFTNSLYGRGVDDGDIDDNVIIASANYCDELLPENGQKRYTCNGVVNIDATHMQNLNHLLSSFRGLPAWVAGQWQLLIDQDQPPSTFDFSEDNIIGEWRIVPPNKKTLFNEIDARFYNPAESWQDDIEPVYSDELKTLDNGQVLKKRLDYPFTSSRWRVNNLATLALNQSRHSITAEFTATIAALAVSVGDIVRVSHFVPGWDGKLFRVVKLDLKSAGEVAVSVREHEPAAYDYGTINPDPVISDTNLPDFRNLPAPALLELESGTEYLLAYGDGTIQSRIFCEFSTVEYADRYEVQYKLSSGGNWTSVFTLENDAYITNVQDGIDYDVRVRALSGGGDPGAWLYVYNHTVIGKTAPPSDVNGFTVTRQPDGTRQFDWLPISDIDRRGYVIRWYLGTTSDWDAMTPLHDGELLASPFETNQLAAGFYTVAIKAIDRSGNESVNATFISSTLGDPRIKNAFVVVNSQLKGWPGTKTNCSVDSTGFQLVAVPAYTWDDLTSWDNWQAWSAPGAATIAYQVELIDLGVVLPFIPLITVDADSVQNIEIDVSTNDIDWTGWHTPSGNELGRYIRVRCTLTQTADELLLFRSFTVIISGDVESETINDANTVNWSGSAAAGRIIPVTKSYSAITSIQIALQNVGAGWSWEIINKSAASPTIKIYNGAGVAADAVIDVEVKGYPLVI